MEGNLTLGSVKKHYFKYLGAAFGSAMISCVYGLVDAAVVGQYEGPSGTAALSVVMPIWTIIFSLGLLFGIGGSVQYSYNKSQGKENKANAYFTLSLIMTALISLICWLGVVLFEEPLLRLFGADDVLLPLCKRYLTAVKFVIPIYPFSQFLTAFLRNDDAPALATFSVLFGGVFNIFGDIFFVFDFGLGLGMFGAGLASAIGGSASVLLMLTHFLSRKNTLRLTRVFGGIRKTKRIFVGGFSSFISDIAMGVIAMLFNRQIMHYFGADALAVFGVIVQVSCIVQCATYGIGQAAQPLLSQNYGANKWDRVKETQRYSLYTVAIFGVLCTAAVLLYPTFFVRIFMSPTNAVLALAPSVMRVYALSFFALPLNIYATYYFQSVMRNGTALAVSLMRGLVLCGIFVFLFPICFGASTLWWVMPITEFFVAVFVLISFSKKQI